MRDKSHFRASRFSAYLHIHSYNFDPVSFPRERSVSPDEVFVGQTGLITLGRRHPGRSCLGYWHIYNVWSFVNYSSFACVIVDTFNDSVSEYCIARICSAHYSGRNQSTVLLLLINPIGIVGWFLFLCKKIHITLLSKFIRRPEVKYQLNSLKWFSKLQWKA